jgi:lipopolysaccharide transport system permease protein
MKAPMATDESALYPAKLGPALAEASAPPVARAPEQPFLRIGPSPGWRAVNLRELWRYRELLYFLVWRDVKVRYKQTLLGAAWAVFRPLLTMLTFWLIFGVIVRVPSDGLPYALFTFVALLPWTYFSNAVSGASNSLLSNSQLLTKVYFPRLIVPTATVVAGLVDYGIAALLLIPLMLYYQIVPPVAALLAIPLLTLVIVLLALGTSLWLSALNVRYRDIGNLVPFLIQLWMYATPIIYPLSKVPAHLRWITDLNPLTGVTQGYRSALFGSPWDWPSLGFSTACGVVVLVSGALYFRRVERTFADLI